MMNIEIANRLVQLRKEHNLSQEELAAKLGLSRQAVSKWERAEASPDTDNLIMLSRVYGVSMDELLKTSDPIPEPEKEKGVKVTINGKPLRLNAKDGFYFSIGDDESDENDGRARTKCNVHGEWNDDDDDDDGDDDGDNDNDDDDAGDKPFLLMFPFPVFVAILYLCLGFFMHLWGTAWLVFLAIPIYYPIVNWLTGSRRRSFFMAFPFTVVMTAAFLTLGMIWGLWHPAWVLFLFIPLYYPAAKAADRYYRKRRAVKAARSINE